MTKTASLHLTLLFAVALSGAATTTLRAQTFTIEWGGGSGDWLNAESWERIPGPGDGPPDDADDVLVSTPQNNLITLQGSEGDPQAGIFDSLTIGGGAAVSVQGFASLTGGDVIVGTNGSTAVLQVLFAESTLNLRDVTLGSGSGSEGELNVTQGGEAGLQSLVVGGGGKGTVFVSGGTNTAILTPVTMSVAGSSSSVTIATNGLIITEGLTMASGQLDIQGGGFMLVEQAGVFSIGSAGGQSAVVNVVGGELDVSATNSGTAVIGAAGEGSLFIGSGGAVSVDSLRLGDQQFSSGTVVVDGAESLLCSFGVVQIGNDGDGALTVLNGATLTARNADNVLQDILLGPATEYGSGTLTIGGSSSNAPGTVEAAQIHGTGTSPGHLVFAHSATNYVFDVPVTGYVEMAFTAGRTTLTATSSTFGNIGVTNATLVVNGDLDGSDPDRTIDVSADAILAGTGKITGKTTVDGIVSPGDGGIGTLTLAGDVTWNADPMRPWRWDLGPDNQSDLLIVELSLLKGSGDEFVFDFGGQSHTGEFTLLFWGGTNEIALNEFHAVGFAPDHHLDSFSFSGSSLVVTVVPEPGTASLFTLGAVLLVVMTLRKARA